MPQDVTIYHNPSCETSRNVLAMIRATGVEPTVIEYLRSPPSRDQLQCLASQIGVSVRSLARQKELLFVQLNLQDPARSEDELLDALEENPILINRPIVVTDKGALLCRPSERVAELLHGAIPGDFRKENGEEVVSLPSP